MAQISPPDATRQARYTSASPQIDKWLHLDGSISAEGDTGVAGTSTAFNTGQVSLGATATQIIAANAGRVRVTIYNVDGNVLFLGNANVTTATGSGVPAVAGFPVVFHTTAAIFGVVASGVCNVSFIEEVA